MIDQRLHFSCAFDLVAKDTALSYQEVLGAVRAWLQGKVRLPYRYSGPILSDAWLVQGVGTPVDFGPHHVESAAEVGNGTKAEPQYWAVRYEHPDQRISQRIWRTNIGLTRENARIHFAISLYHYLKAGFIGREEMPDPSAPLIVKKLMDSSHDWTCELSGVPLEAKPYYLQAGKGNVFRDLLIAKNRRFPIVFTSRTNQGYFLADPVKLADRTAGVALVIAPADHTVDNELSHLIDQPFRTFDGAIRVYQPGLSFDDPADSRRHRYFNREVIDRIGIDEVERDLIRGLLRQVSPHLSTFARNLEDVRDRVKEERLKQPSWPRNQTKSGPCSSRLETLNSKPKIKKRKFKYEFFKIR